jgi:hypothetical protein
MGISTLTLNNLVGDDVVISTLSVSTLSSIATDVVNGRQFNGSTVTVLRGSFNSTITNSTTNTSTLLTINGFFSTLTTSTILARNVTVSTLQVSTLTNNSTITTSSIIGVRGFVSTLQVSTLTASTILGDAATMSTLTVSSILTASTLHFSSLVMLPGYLTTLDTGYTNSMVIQIGANMCLIPVVVL